MLLSGRTHYSSPCRPEKACLFDDDDGEHCLKTTITTTAATTEDSSSRIESSLGKWRIKERTNMNSLQKCESRAVSVDRRNVNGR